MSEDHVVGVQKGIVKAGSVLRHMNGSFVLIVDEGCLWEDGGRGLC